MDCHYKFLRMPFGMMNSGATLTRAVKKLLCGMDTVVDYIDDLLIHTETWEAYVKTISELFKLLQEANLTNLKSKVERNLNDYNNDDDDDDDDTDGGDSGDSGVVIIMWIVIAVAVVMIVLPVLMVMQNWYLQDQLQKEEPAQPDVEAKVAIRLRERVDAATAFYQADKTSENQGQVQNYRAEEIHTSDPDEEFRQPLKAKSQKNSIPISKCSEAMGGTGFQNCP
ncbi:retrovirus-related pol polyprotein from transposon 297 [Plakobranchus ocellatus]|uniref:Retrovirus-related pol polyprotein from transposon 297 n=1 Tax=Plakobranchus ocellatus TaxID=259542 RepID=A0AAV4C735_9GAST|nr:retrovirus-related pol polyprotein from transposon 297 [Plakobranchus ocellatus]